MHHNSIPCATATALLFGGTLGLGSTAEAGLTVTSAYFNFNAGSVHATNFDGSAEGSLQGVVWFDVLKLWEEAPEFFTSTQLYPASWVSDVVPFAVGLTPAGSYPSVSGGAEWNAWNVSAEGGVTADGSTVYGTNNGASLKITFGDKPGTDGSGLHGVGGTFRFLDEAGAFFTGEVRIELSNGTAEVRSFSKTNPFAGFWSTDPLLTITSMEIMPYGLTPPDFSIGIQDLYLGYAGVPVPAPGAIALLGAAGLVTGRRRR
jgi:hypothetical protein